MIGGESDGSPITPSSSPTKSPARSAGLLRSNTASLDAGGEAIKVCVRVRPFNKREKELGTGLCVAIEKQSRGTVIVTNPKDQKQAPYTFDRAYWSHDPDDSHFASQQTLMDELGEELVQSTLDGYNGCFFCYGQTGSGKTFSLLGSKDPPELEGLLPRVVRRLFHHIHQNDASSQGHSTTVIVNYIEIYNEQINDLLAPKDQKTEKKLEVRQVPKVGVVIPGVTDRAVTDHHGAMAALNRGMSARAVSSTSMNPESSRSHCIFTMDISRKMLAENGAKIELRSKVNFVDLAGSERQKKTNASGDGLKEGAAINQSLSNLTVVISKLAELQTKDTSKKSDKDFVPFRNSKLTFALMDSLNGNSKTVMLAALSPAADNYDETLQCLAFAQKVKSVKTKSKKNEVLEDEVVRDLRRQLHELQEQLRNGSPASTTSAAQRNTAELEEMEEHLKDLIQREEKMKHALDDGGLTLGEISEALGVAGDTPQLINKSFDPALDGCLIFLVEKDKEISAGSKEGCDMRMPGLEPLVALIRNRNGQLFIKCAAGRVLLNGRQVRAQEEQMQHGDRLLISYSSAFLVNFPAEAERERRARSEKVEKRKTLTIDDMRMEGIAHLKDSDAYQQFQAYLEVLENSTELGKVRARVFEKQFRKLLLNVQEANQFTESLRPKDRFSFAAELLTDPRQTGSIPEMVVRLKKFATGAARWRYITRLNMDKKKSKLSHAVNFIMHQREHGKEPFETVALLSLEAFRDRLELLEQLQGLRDRGGEIDMSNPAGDPWRAWVTSSDVAAAVQARERKLTEEHGYTQRRMKKLELQLHQAKARISELEAQLKRAGTGAPAGLRGATGRSVAFADDGDARAAGGNGSLGAFGKDSHLAGLHEQVEAAFAQGLAADQEESRALQRHLERVEACASEEFRTCTALHSEARAALRSEVSCLRMELEHAQAEAVSELAEQRASSRSALELVEFYIMHSSRAQESSAADLAGGFAPAPRTHYLR